MAKVSKEEPLISVIIPVYKVEKYLDRCVDSVVNQTYSNLEIILVDDGSPDKCPQMCDEWAKKDKRIKVIHKENGGLSDARNVGFQKSNGKYIMFADSDDWIDCKIVNILYKELQKNDADFVSCKPAEVFGLDDKINFKKFTKNVECYNQRDYMKKFFRIDNNEVIHYAWGKLYKKEILDNNQFPIGLTSEDVVGTYKAILKSNVIVEIDYPYYFYFKNNDSITRTTFGKKDFDLFKIWDIVIELMPNDNPDYLSWATFNKNRVDYTLLMRMAKSLNYQNIKEKYSKEMNEMLKRLKINKKILLSSKISLLRKISIILICINYRCFVSLCSIIRKIS